LAPLKLNLTQILTRVGDQLALKGLHTGWLGMVDTRSEPVASRRLSAGWLTCCYSRRAMRRRECVGDGCVGDGSRRCAESRPELEIVNKQQPHTHHSRFATLFSGPPV